MIPSTQSPEDEVFPARLATRDTAASALLHDRRARPAAGCAVRMLHDVTAAEPAVHEAFRSRWRRAAPVDPERTDVRSGLPATVHRRAGTGSVVPNGWPQAAGE